MSEQTPYFTTSSGTRVYGSNRPGVSAWNMFDAKLADELKPEKRSSGGAVGSIVPALKIGAAGILGGPVSFIVLFHMVGLPGFICWLIFFGLFFGLPAYGVKMVVDSNSENKSAKSFNADSEQQALSIYNNLTTRARSGDIDTSIPPQIRSWALGAFSEERVGAVLESLGPQFEVSHDVTIFQNNREVANIDHLVSSSEGLIMVDAKSWSGRVAVDQSTAEITSGDARTDEYRRKAVHSLRRESESLNMPLRAVVVAVDKGKVVGEYNGQKTDGIARILDDYAFDTYIVEIDMLAELMSLLNASSASAAEMPEVAKIVRSKGSQIQF